MFRSLEKKEKDPTLPRRVLYATSARIGGVGLDAVALETLRGLHQARILRRAIAFDDNGSGLPSDRVSTLRAHPVRLLSFLEPPFYYGAKKHALDRAAAGWIRRGRFDLFHGWSGECLHSLREARRRGIPTIIEVGTWHRNKGVKKPRITEAERALLEARFPRSLLNRLLVSRQQVLEEYDLADRIIVLSEKAAETFLSQGIPESKLVRGSRGVDPVRFFPAESRPTKFRALFVGALLKRKGVDTLLDAWHRLGLPDAELYLAGTVHREIRADLERFASPSVKVLGFTPRVEDCYRQATIHVFPSTCEGSAKATYEAAACGLPQVATRESGDVVVDGLNGIVVPCGDAAALAAAIEKLYRDPALVAEMGAAARRRIVEGFTWDHFRARVLDAYRALLAA